MKTLKVLAALLTYPEAALVTALPELKQALLEEPQNKGNAVVALAEMFNFLTSNSLLELQQNYVATFDQNRSHSLHLFEHVYGESKDRGQAMVDLMQEYEKQGLYIAAEELPDYIPLFLEYLAHLPDEQALALLAEAIDVLAAIGRRLAANGSPYATIFSLLETLSPVAAKPLAEPPVRDMDEAMATFGVEPNGSEPLLTPQKQIIQFYPKGHIGTVSKRSERRQDEAKNGDKPEFMGV